jgi:phospholipase/carboxylesterase
MRIATAVAVSLLAAAPAVAQPPAGPPGELGQAIQRKDWPRAVELARAEARAKPDSPRAAYNLACVEALAGERDQAVASLNRAADLGFAFVATLLRDADLDPIRGHPGFDAVLDRVKANNARELETFKARAADAKVLVFKPARLDPRKPAPLVVALHGRGGTADAFAPLWRRVASNVGAVLAVPKGVNPAGNGFDWGVVEQASHLVLRAIEKARAEAPIDDSKIVLAGFSAGGAQAFIQGLQDPDRFAGILSIAGFYDERVAPVPTGRRLPRFVILNGERDEEAANNRRGAAALRAAGGQVKLEIYPGLGHAFPPDHERELASALRFLLAK